MRIPATWDARWYAQHWAAIHASLERVRFGTGSPEGVVTAPVGTLYLRTDGGANTTLYIKESGAAATGWIAK